MARCGDPATANVRSRRADGLDVLRGHFGKVRLLLAALMLAYVALAVNCRPEATAPFESPKTESSKLSSQLVHLVQAEEQGKVASFAEQNAIDLVGSRVRVIVEVIPGQIDDATRAAAGFGEVEASYDDMLQMMVPIGRLTALAEGPGIRLVRLPRQAAPAKGTST